MTVRELVQALSQQPQAMALALGAPAILAWVLGLVHRRGLGHRGGLKYAYAAIVYAACLPGMAAIALVAYTLLFTQENMLDASLLVYGAPIVGMTAALALVARNADMDALPGFGRLWGLMLMLGMTFLGVFLLSRLRFGVFFHGSAWQLALAGVALFLVFRFGVKKAFGRRV